MAPTNVQALYWRRRIICAVWLTSTIMLIVEIIKWSKPRGALYGWWR